jgi:integrase
MNITIYPREKDAADRVRLYLFVSINGQPAKFPTKVKINSECWHQSKQMCTAKQPDSKQINMLLTKRVAQLNKVFQDLEYEGITPTLPIVRARYNASLSNQVVKAGIRQLSLLEYIDQYCDDRRKIRSDKGYLRKFKPMKTHLVVYKPDVSFKDMTVDFYNSWLTYLYDDRELESNTTSGYLKKLKSVLKAAVMDPRTRHQNIPTDFLLWKDTYVKPKPFYLDWESDVKAIEDHEPLDEQLPYKQFFLFQCYTGLRHIDVFNLKPENIIRRADKVYLDFMGIKTKADQNLLLSPKAVAILKAWNWKVPRLYQDDCNKQIKEICKAVKLNVMVEKVRYAGSERKVSLLPKWSLVTTHTARRTFGRRWMENGGSLRNLMIYYGHSSEKQTAEYIGWTTEEVNNELTKIMI